MIHSISYIHIQFRPIKQYCVVLPDLNVCSESLGIVPTKCRAVAPRQGEEEREKKMEPGCSPRGASAVSRGCIALE